MGENGQLPILRYHMILCLIVIALSLHLVIEKHNR